MKYRIKIVTMRNGRVEYYPMFKKWWGWTGLFVDGQESGVHKIKFAFREQALHAIDKHNEGNNTVQRIDFEYITK